MHSTGFSTSLIVSSLSGIFTFSQFIFLKSILILLVLQFVSESQKNGVLKNNSMIIRNFHEIFDEVKQIYFGISYMYHLQ